MTWKNAFDTGDCVVTVTEVLTGTSATVLFSSVVAKGASTTFQSANFSGSTFTLAVDSAGGVALTVDGSPYLGGFEFDVDIAPASTAGVIDGRVSDFLQYVDVNGVAAGKQAVRADGVTGTWLSSATPGASVTPNPAPTDTVPLTSIGAALMVSAG
jgi:hypothetical protein